MFHVLIESCVYCLSTLVNIRSTNWSWRAQSASEAMNYLNPNNFKLHINICGNLLIRLTTSPSPTCTAVCKVRASPLVGIPPRTTWCNLMWSGLVQMIPAVSQSRVSVEVKRLNKRIGFSTRVKETAPIWLTCHLKYLITHKGTGGIPSVAGGNYLLSVNLSPGAFLCENRRKWSRRTRSSVSNEPISDYSFACGAFIIFDLQNKIRTSFKSWLRFKNRKKVPPASDI